MGILDMFSKKDDEQEEKEESTILTKDLIRLNLDPMDKEEAIKLAGQLLVDNGYVEEEYVEGMLEREGTVSTYMGNGVAIPHGTNEAKQYIKETGISLLQFPEGIDFGDGDVCRLLIGIAGQGDDHMEILQNLATVCQDEDTTEELMTTSDKELIMEQLI
ncbi:PTS sugar transporter subunit IIA [Halanaerobacter jeridensis]|uniref:Mannitol-specific phosphotransferase enzyme IIA component n=1 Tax=Halanaerobacter jeridensis TaxID=706427 RepID=A0A939BQ73_9FIRM|nr:PTS sugar transporter subunit IIA [Halanaerobacter jeridensis]MBM7557962.1 mannitol/fructose-specific phosphotransferase system IIA component [Halanaerobacter jeridensis]